MLDHTNKLPFAVDVISGGTASPRIGGSVISIEDIASGSIALGEARRFRVYPNLRSWSGKLFLLGFTNPVNLSNAEYVISSSAAEIRDSIPAGTTLYWALISSTAYTPVLGGANDFIAVTRYE